ncbi:NADH-quinone oxidoreductase subunit E [Streptomyces lunaelactis]|uniref:NADH-quinone oxidoreductase subunit E n=1 Tax=Streptomyces lunaelactis TaxID=1535768 RepID=A0A2R4TAX2_9ACTN|nr:NADH-ubiquinone oxidoreductase-F iron-sulfur binding region domain-containing protein [Streptomyces lunaelactis]AVZ76286.1 NADH-quinone oxidoreductase subunit E [Streptomyces lunaelactis]
MDLKFADAAKVSDDERAAVDGLLGPAGTGWEGGTERTDEDLRWARGGAAARDRRDLLLPALHAVNDRVGWLSEGALDYICRRLTVPPAEAYGVATFYSMFSVKPRASKVLHVCTDLACAARGGSTALAEGLGPDVAVQPSPCLGLCERAPAALLLQAGAPSRGSAPPAPRGSAPDPAPQSPAGLGVPGGAEYYATAVIAPAGVEAVVSAVNAPQHAPDEPPAAAAVPQAGDPGLVLLKRVGLVDPTSLDDYRANGGYAALRRAFAIGPAAVIREVTDAGLLGRGGAAFPTGRKWQATASQPDHPHYLVCNADESEPGTFKDRVLMEGDPYALIEAMTIAGYAIGAHQGYLYLRGEYPRALERLGNAIARARARGLLGEDVLGQGYAFDIEIRRGAGAYICGEETAIFNSIEGYRGEPRSKPPFPVEKGLFGKPTAVNNVETLVNVLPILTGRAEETKLFCLSGNVGRPGVYELPFGATLRELIELAGPPGAMRAVLLGGAAGSFVRPDELDITLTFEGTRAAGTTLGSGVVLVLGDTVELPRILLRIAEFFRDESCGQCVPCRVGTVRQEEALHRIKDRTGADAADDIVLLREVGRAMRDASICGLGQTAWNAVESAIDRLGAYE